VRRRGLAVSAGFSGFGMNKLTKCFPGYSSFASVQKGCKSALSFTRVGPADLWIFLEEIELENSFWKWEIQPL
jgi:hypothetical protein